MIKTVFLDLDDTIFDFHKAEGIALSDTLRELGIEPTAAVLARYSEINRAHWERLELGELTREQVLHGRFRVLFAELGVSADEYEAQRIYEWRLGTGHYFLEGAEWLLDELYAHYPLYLASNGTDIVQSRRIASAGIEHYFKELFISQRLGADKPSADFFERAFSKIEGFEREGAIIVGDSLSSDIKGGKNAGILTCWYNPHGKENHTGITPDYEIASLYELPRLLENI